MAMKLNKKQIDDIARLLGTLAASSVIGLSVGAARPESVTSYEEVGLISSTIIAFSMMLYTRS
jgi:hypothetical protein